MINNKTVFFDYVNWKPITTQSRTSPPPPSSFHAEKRSLGGKNGFFNVPGIGGFVVDAEATKEKKGNYVRLTVTE